MKRNTLFLLALVSLFFISSCSKENDDEPTPATKTNEELLVQHVWKMEELLHVENNTQLYYKRGGSTNTNNYDNDKITFLANGTGTYSPTPSETLSLTWEFTNAEKTKLDMVITFTPSITLTLKCSEVRLSDTRFFCVNNYTNTSGKPVLASVNRTPL